MYRIRWAEGLWALLVLVAAATMACGLADAFTFLVEPPTYPVGHRLVLLGALGFAGAAVWAWLRPAPRWVTVLTALPAVVIGGLALQFEDGGWGVVAGIFLIPVDVVAQAGAVGGVVVAAEDHELFAAPDGDLGDEGNQIVGDALGVLTDPAGGVRAHGVEVTQQGDVPARVGVAEVGEDVLDVFLGPAVRIVGADFHLFDVGDGVVLAIDGCAGAEYEGSDIMAVHDADQVQRAHEVVVVVLEGFAD